MIITIPKKDKDEVYKFDKRRSYCPLENKNNYIF